MSGLARVRFFVGQLLTAADFQAEQDYHRTKARRHNRYLHGAGVVSGFAVSLGENEGEWAITVAPGFAIDPEGNDIELCEPAIIPLQPGSGRLLVELRYTEARSVVAASENGPAATRIVEGHEIVLTPVPSSPPTSNAGSPDCGVILARLAPSKGGWRLDRRFRVQRTR